MAALVLWAGCSGPGDQPAAPAGGGGDAHPWTDTPAAEAGEQFSFAIVADRTGGHRAGVFESAMTKLNLMRPAFVMTVGDLVEGYTSDPQQIDRMWSEWLGMVNTLEMRCYFVAGNHDVTSDAMVADWHRRFGPTHYAFEHGGCLFVVLSTCESSPYGIDAEQAAWAERALAEHADVRWTFVFMHVPQWVAAGNAKAGDAAATQWPRIEAALAGRPHTVFAGHWHNYVRYERGGREYIVLATTGGSSGLSGADFGQFDAITWVTMTADGPRIANVEIGAVHPSDVRTERSQAIDQAIAERSGVDVNGHYCEEPSFAGCEATVRLVNETDYTATARVAFDPPGQLTPSPYAFERAVAPHTTERVSVRMAASPPAPAAAVQPATGTWSMRFDVPDRAPITRTGTLSFGVTSPYACPRAPAEVVVDGSLAEWGALPIAATDSRSFTGNRRWRGPADASFDMAVAYDAQYIYLAIATRDDSPVFDPALEPWEQDGLEVRLDFRSREARAEAATMKAFDEIVAFNVSPGAAPGQVVCPEADRLPPGSRLACVRTEGGLAMEAAIPVAYVERMAGGPWRDFRLNVSMDDKDATLAGAAAFRQFNWQAKWKSPGQTTGTFVRR